MSLKGVPRACGRSSGWNYCHFHWQSLCSGDGTDYQGSAFIALLLSLDRRPST